MKSIICELQSEATKQTSSTVELLRKSKVIASKLDLGEFLTWVNNELNGYVDVDAKKIPIYRLVKGETRGWNPVRGWIPVMFSNARIQKVLSQIPVSQQISELEDLYNSNSKELQIAYSAETQQIIGEATGFQTRFALIVDRSSIAGILDGVRNVVLDWSIRLEKEGILGEGISFSTEDKENAQKPSTLVKVGKIDTFVGNIGSMEDNASVNVAGITSHEIGKIKDLVEQIRTNIEAAGLTKKDKAQVNQKVESIEAEIAGKNPKKSKVDKCFSAIRRILQGVPSNMVAQGILYGIGKIFE